VTHHETGSAVLVFIHGLIGSFADPRALSALKPATTLAPDLHGYGSALPDRPDEITIDRQVDFVRRLIDREARNARVHLIGHSLGGVVAAGYAHQFPDRVASFVNVEGNFTLADAFWSRQLAAKPPSEVQRIPDRDRSDPAGWLREAGIDRPRSCLGGRRSRGVSARHGRACHGSGRRRIHRKPRYTRMLRHAFDQVPVHLVAGARSRSGCDVRDWAIDAAASYTEIPDAGHMGMLEAPEALGTELRRLLVP